MVYSLLSRFQGALVGAALGEDLKGRAASQLSALPPQSQRLWGKVAVLLMQDLMQRGGWYGVRQAGSLYQEALHQGLLTPEQRLTGFDLALITLPLALFFHEAPAKRLKVCQEFGQVWPCDSLAIAEAWSWTTALTALVLGTSSGALVLTQVLTALQTFQPAGWEQLEQPLQLGQDWLRRGVGLHRVWQELPVKQPLSSDRAIALALYCALSVPSDFTLAIGRGAQIQPLNLQLCCLIGALVGAATGLSGIPVDWRAPYSQLVVPSWGLSVPALSQMAGQLLALWAGAAHPLSFETVPAIAAPGIIRPR